MEANAIAKLKPFCIAFLFLGLFSSCLQELDDEAAFKMRILLAVFLAKPPVSFEGACFTSASYSCTDYYTDTSGTVTYLANATGAVPPTIEASCLFSGGIFRLSPCPVPDVGSCKSKYYYTSSTYGQSPIGRSVISYYTGIPGTPSSTCQATSIPLGSFTFVIESASWLSERQSW